MKVTSLPNTVYQKMASSVFSSIRQSWLKRNTLFLASVFAGALVAEIVVDGGVGRFWEWNNRGKLWKDVASNLGLEGDSSDSSDSSGNNYSE